MDWIYKDGLLSLLRSKVAEYGTQKEAAKFFGISSQFLNDVLLGRREPSAAISNGLGLAPCMIWTPINAKVKTQLVFEGEALDVESNSEECC